MLSFRISGGLISTLVAACLCWAMQATADDNQMPAVKVDVLKKGSSASKTHEQAQSDLPLQSLTPEQRRRVEGIVKNRSMFRRLPTVGMNSEPALYHYFTHNPEAAVGIWRVLDISQFKLTPAGPNVWKGDSGDGSQGTIEVLYRSPHQQLLVCEGEYKSPVLSKPIKTQAVMHLRSTFPAPGKATHAIEHEVDLFVTFPSQAIDTVAKVIAPVSNTIADKNFRELSMFVQFMSVAMHSQPGWIEQVIQRLDGVRPEQKEELMKLSAQIFVAARKAELKQPGVEPASFDQVLAPFQPAK